MRHAIIGWDQGRTWGSRSRGCEAITPGGIAAGKGDAFLVALNRAIHGFGRRVYLRPLPEMNAHWNAYSAFDRDGSRRG